jgi:predicted component of type VI protein secretion system
LVIKLSNLLQKNNELLLQISFTTPVADFIINNAIEQHKQIIELNQKYNDLVNHKDNKKEIKEEEQRVLEEYNYQKNNFIC